MYIEGLYDFLGTGSVGITRDCLKFFGYPVLAMDFKYDRYIRRVHPNFREKAAWPIRDCPIFGYPILSQELVKLYRLNFVHIIHRVDRNKSLQKFFLENSRVR